MLTPRERARALSPRRAKPDGPPPLRDPLFSARRRAASGLTPSRAVSYLERRIVFTESVFPPQSMLVGGDAIDCGENPGALTVMVSSAGTLTLHDSHVASLAFVSHAGTTT